MTFRESIEFRSARTLEQTPCLRSSVLDPELFVVEQDRMVMLAARWLGVDREIDALRAR